jgi:hypothetical protein
MPTKASKNFLRSGGILLTPFARTASNWRKRIYDDNPQSHAAAQVSCAPGVELAHD